MKRAEESSAGQEEMVGLTVDELARLGAQRRLKAAVEVEVRAYVAAHQEERDAQGRALGVRNGHARGRQVTLGSGTLTVQAPRVDDRRVDGAGARRRFRSRMLPPSRRRALPVLLGEAAAGRSPPPITRLTAAWETEYTAFRQRDLRDHDYVSIWGDGVHFTLGRADARLCTLVVIGARADGTKEVLAVEDGYRESTESWRTGLRD